MELLSDSARLWEDLGEDPERAFEVTRTAFLLAPDVEGTREKVVVSAAMVDSWRTDAGSGGGGRGWRGPKISSVRIPFETAGNYGVTITLPDYEPTTIKDIEITTDRETRVEAFFRKKSE